MTYKEYRARIHPAPIQRTKTLSSGEHFGVSGVSGLVSGEW